MKINCKIDISGFRRLRNRTIKQLGRDTVAAVNVGLRAGTEYARGHHQHSRRTGNLSSGKTLHYTIDSQDARGAMGAMRNDAPYAGFVEYGTRPHRIPGKGGSGKILRFDIGTPSAHGFNVDSSTVYAKFVNHPGTKPMAFMHPGARVAIESIRRQTLVSFARAGALWR